MIEQNKELHYRALRRTQSTLTDEPSDGQPWLGFFLRSLKKQKNRLMAQLEKQQVFKLDESQLPELTVQVLHLIRSQKRQTIAQLVEATGANRNTLKVRLRELVALGKL